LVAAGAAIRVSAAEPNAQMLAALRPLDGLIGTWKGAGTSTKSAGWNETASVNWGFRDTDGRVSINLVIEGGEFLEAGVLTFSPQAKVYRFITQDKKGRRLYFEGKPVGKQSLRLDRTDKDVGDSLDRLDLKLVRSGSKLVYAFSQKVGRTAYQQVAQVELFLEGPTVEDLKNAPRCVVTGTTGRLAVEYQGKTFHVACEACKRELLDHPERYVK
jgi:YHS domain-containing protein